MKSVMMMLVLASAWYGLVGNAGEPHRRFVLVDFATQNVHLWD